MKTLHALLAVACLGAITACQTENAIDGNLIVNQDLVVTDKDGKTQTIPGGKSYDAKITMSDKGSEIDVSTGLFSSIDFLIPSPTKDQTGDFATSADDTKQSFAVAGNITDDERQVDGSHNESCVAGTTQNWVCDANTNVAADVALNAALAPGHGGGNPPAPPANGGGHGGGTPPPSNGGGDHGGGDNHGGGNPPPANNGGDHGGDNHGGDNHGGNNPPPPPPPPHCYWQTVTLYGNEYVRETDDVVNKDVKLNFTGTSGSAVASFTASYQLSSSVISQDVGPCIR